LTFSFRTDTDAEISSDGKFLALVKRGRGTLLFDLELKKSVAAFAAPDCRSNYIAISPDGTLLAEEAEEGIRLWKISR